jgi:hypothetical protein
MRFNAYEVWTNKAGRRAVVLRTDDDGRRGLLLFGDDGGEGWFNWQELTQAGQWMLDRSPRPTKSADELKSLILLKMAHQPACPKGMSLEIVALGQGKWRADSVPPQGQHIGWADCAHYIGMMARAFGQLYALKGDQPT